MIRNSRDIYVTATLTAIIIFSLFAQYYFRNCVLDDPFISFRYADNLATGNGLVFNPGERVEGISNPLWTIGFSFFSLIGLNYHHFGLLVVAKIIGAICAILCIIFTYKLSLALDGRNLISRRLHLLSPLLVGLCPFFTLWAQGGLESSFLSLLLILACCHLTTAANIDLGLTPVNELQDRKNRHLFLSGLYFGFAALTRPEIPLLFIVAFAGYLIVALKWNIKDTGLLSGIGAFIFLVGGYEIFRIVYYGDIFPNSYYAKISGGWPQYLFGLVYLQEGFRYLLGPISISFLMFGPLFQRGRDAIPSKILLAIIFSYFAFIIIAGGDWMPKYRFHAHIFPLIAAIAGMQLSMTILWILKKINAKPFAHAIVIVLLIIVIGSPIYGIKQLRSDYYQYTGRWSPASGNKNYFINKAYLNMGMYLRKYAQRDDYVALGEAGTVPYIGRFLVIDCYGLMDRHIAKLKGMRNYKFDGDYVMGRKPEWILLLGRREEDGTFRSEHNYAKVLLSREDFRKDYDFEIHFDQLLLFKRKNGLL